MFVVFTQPATFTRSYNEAVAIADAHFDKTREVVAVEQFEFKKHIYLK